MEKKKKVNKKKAVVTDGETFRSPDDARSFHMLETRNHHPSTRNQRKSILEGGRIKIVFRRY